MGKNLKQQYTRDNTGRIFFEDDWYGKGIPHNVSIGNNVYLSSSMGFQRIVSIQNPCLTIGDEVGLYDQFLFEIGERGVVSIGDYSVFKGRINCSERISIGNFCMISWGVFIFDSWPDSNARSAALKNILSNPEQEFSFGNAEPVIIEDNVWIGFDSVIMPGVRIGKGSIVASKSVVSENVPSGTIVAGNPGRIIKVIGE